MWICCQLGGREHYAIPRALVNTGEAVLLCTDIWVPQWSLLHMIPSRRLRGRYHDGLRSVTCHHFSVESILRDSSARMTGAAGNWEKTIRKNEWFESRVVKCLRKVAHTENVIVFAYSYAARRIFEYAKDRGWQTILGQIDPGKREEDIVRMAHERHAWLGSQSKPAPASYWSSWRKECELADIIMANSEWSAEMLSQEGVPKDKIRIIPLAYDVEARYQGPRRILPDSFSRERPLRILFLGQVIIRKGIGELLDAADRLRTMPVQFIIVGPHGIDVPQRYGRHPLIRWIGPIPRSEVGAYYRAADVFLFPTLSDGFGLTQIEAAVHGLPIISSRRCGIVVQDGFNGILLDEVSGESIAEAIARLVDHPDLVQRLSNRPTEDCFSLGNLGASLLSMQRELIDKKRATS